MKRLLFASPHCLFDCGSGAAITTLDLLHILAERAINCEALCASKFDITDGPSIEQTLANLAVPYREAHITLAAQSHRVLFARARDVPTTLFPTATPRPGQWSAGEPEEVLALFERTLKRFRPDVLLTYGGDLVAQGMHRFARDRGVPVVFALHNLAYDDRKLFRAVDHVIVPSRFAQQHYRDTVGIDSHVIPNAILPSRVLAVDRAPAYVTFVNPQPAKGLFVFARIAEVVAKARPDIPILVVESRGRTSWLEQVPVDLSWATNLHAMQTTIDPRDFYRITRVLLAPSLTPETFGLVAVEAMMNGIPVIASNRGALPETIARAGDVLDIPARCTAQFTQLPTPEEVAPWIDAIIRLWDNDQFYRERSEAARARAAMWHPRQLGPIAAEFFFQASLGVKVNSRAASENYSLSPPGRGLG